MALAATSPPTTTPSLLKPAGTLPLLLPPPLHRKPLNPPTLFISWDPPGFCRLGSNELAAAAAVDKQQRRYQRHRRRPVPAACSATILARGNKPSLAHPCHRRAASAAVTAASQQNSATTAVSSSSWCRIRRHKARRRAPATPPCHPGRGRRDRPPRRDTTSGPQVSRNSGI